MNFDLLPNCHGTTDGTMALITKGSFDTTKVREVDWL